MLLRRSLILSGIFIFCVSVPCMAQGFFYGPDKFIYMEDAPEEQEYENQAGKGLIVNDDEDGLEFTPIVTRVSPMTGDLDMGNNDITSVRSIQFQLINNITDHSEGRIYWNDDDKTVNMDTDITSVVLQIGQEMFMRVVNKTGSTISNGAPVYISGTQGNRPTIALADADLHNTMHQLAGLVTHEINNNNNGYVTTAGLVRDIDTSIYSAGTILYVSQTSGALTDTAPAAPAHAVRIGIVLVQNASTGIILVDMDRRTEMYELHDVDDSLSSPTDGYGLFWNNSNSLWEEGVGGELLIDKIVTASGEVVAAGGNVVIATGD